MAFSGWAQQAAARDSAGVSSLLGEAFLSSTVSVPTTGVVPVVAHEVSVAIAD